VKEELAKLHQSRAFTLAWITFTAVRKPPKKVHSKVKKEPTTISVP
jgi:hypothetical protein